MQPDIRLCRMEGKNAAEKREQSGGLTGRKREASSHGERAERETSKPLYNENFSHIHTQTHTKTSVTTLSPFFSPFSFVFSCRHLFGSLHVSFLSRLRHFATAGGRMRAASLSYLD